MVNYSHIIGEAMVLMYKPSMIDSPSCGAPVKAPDGISRLQKVAVVEKWFLAPLMFLGYKSIYRRKKYVGGAPWGP